MSSQGGPDSLTHKPLFAGGLQFSDGTLAEDVFNGLPATLPFLVALSATSLARARGHGDAPLAAVLIAEEILNGAVHTAEEPATPTTTPPPLVDCNPSHPGVHISQYNQ